MDIKDFYSAATKEMHKADNQRFSFFNYFLIISALLVNAIVLSIRDGIYFLAITISISLAFISILFIFLEKRNAYNYKRLNDLLIKYEEIISDNRDPKEMEFEYVHTFRRKKIYEENKQKHKMAQTIIFKTIYGVFFVIGIVAIVLSIILWTI